MGFPNGSAIKKLPFNAGNTGEASSVPGLGRSRGEGMATHSTTLAGKSQGQRSLMGYSPWGRNELDTTEVTEHAHIPKHHRLLWVI